MSFFTIYIICKYTEYDAIRQFDEKRKATIEIERLERCKRSNEGKAKNEK